MAGQATKSKDARRRKRKQKKFATLKQKPLRPADDSGESVLIAAPSKITGRARPCPKINRLPRQQRNRVDRALERARFEQPTPDLIYELEYLIERHPHIEKLYNALAKCYGAAGHVQQAYAIVEQMYQRFPHYLFAISNYVTMCLQRGRIDEVASILDGVATLQDLYPDRKEFHISEVLTFHGIFAEYLCHIGELESAAAHLDVLYRVDPNHSATRRIESLLAGSA